MDPFWGFTLKTVLGIHDPRISWLPFGTKNHEIWGPPVYQLYYPKDQSLIFFAKKKWELGELKISGFFWVRHFEFFFQQRIGLQMLALLKKLSKGQKKSEPIYGVLNSSKERTKNHYPEDLFFIKILRICNLYTTHKSTNNRTSNVGFIEEAI